ncbi:MAG TPA: LPS export ABC transporter ATP-binding protein [Gemmatimonadaceae bacterium]|jgi:lipopolysaccharide export system ATP-binding protein|nr:LPS export ABC transporter ATP-binding protein [Gemmatimonadaceae bacterium]
MTAPTTPPPLQALVDRLAKGDRSAALALHALICVADESGSAAFNDVAVQYRNDHLEALRVSGADSEREAGRLSMDEVRRNLAVSVLPRLASEGIVVLPPGGPQSPDARLRLDERVWREISGVRTQLADVLKHTGEHPSVRAGRSALGLPTNGKRSVLEARGLVKKYRRRPVVNEVALSLQQGEIVGLLGPNGAGKTTTFYMIVGLIQPLSGHILLDGVDITSMPMYQRSRKGIGYLSQEPSIFRKLSVEDNIVAILETLPLSGKERDARLETLLDELNIKHLRNSKAFQLSGGERRRLEITRALVSQPKFMMLDEPFAGVDPIAVHDIQTIVADLRHRGIGVLISDHNVEQTLDIVDRAYIMFDGQVKVSGTVRELVFDETVADIYLGPTLSARLRARFADESGSESV